MDNPIVGYDKDLVTALVFLDFSNQIKVLRYSLLELEW